MKPFNPATCALFIAQIGTFFPFEDEPKPDLKNEIEWQLSPKLGSLTYGQLASSLAIICRFLIFGETTHLGETERQVFLELVNETREFFLDSLDDFESDDGICWEEYIARMMCRELLPNVRLTSRISKKRWRKLFENISDHFMSLSVWNQNQIEMPPVLNGQPYYETTSWLAEQVERFYAAHRTLQSVWAKKIGQTGNYEVVIELRLNFIRSKYRKVWTDRDSPPSEREVQEDWNDYLITWERVHENRD